MSDLENLARPTIGSLVQDISTSLDKEQQKIIVQWSYKTSMVMESMSRRHQVPFYTDDERSGLRSGSRLPFPGHVWLARYGGTYDVASFGMHIRNDAPGKAAAIHGYVSTILAGRLAIQLLTFHVPEDYGDRPIPIQPYPAPWGECLIPVWPYQRTVFWPPEVTIRDSGPLSLRMLVGRWSKRVALPVGN